MPIFQKRQAPTIFASSWWHAAICLTLFAASSAAQTRTSTLEGSVRDESGGAIPHADVTLRERGTNQMRRALTDAEGFFRLTELPVGSYELRVDFAGFAPYRHEGIELAIGQTARVAIVLEPAALVETVNVTDQPPSLDAAQTAMTTSIDTERIEELPVRSRNYLEFVLLAPGVTRSADAASASALPDSGFSFGGLRPRSNTLSVDGLDNSDEFTGGSRTELSLEIVREFQVVNNGWSAENGGASGGSINVVTKSGANVVHGDAFLFGQSGVLNAWPKLEETDGMRPSLTRYRGGLAVGGPVRRDRTFFYGAAEREHVRGEAASDIDPEAARSIDDVLSSSTFRGLAARRLTAGLFPVARSETEWSGKITHQLANTGSLVVRAAGTDTTEDQDAFNTGGLTDRSARGSRATRDAAVTASWTTTQSNRVTNDVRTQYATRRLDQHTTDRDGPGVVISGVAEFGTPYMGNNTHSETYVDAGDVIAGSFARHLLKAGASLRHVGLTGTTADGFRGLYVFRSFDAFQRGKPDSFRQTFGGSHLDASSTRASAFVQDHLSAGAALTIDVGLRIDATDLTPALGATSRQVNPRAGLAWMPARDWVIRAGAGIFADRLVLASLERIWLTQQQGLFEQIVPTSRARAVLLDTFGSRLTSPLDDVAPSSYATQRGPSNSRSRQASVGVERQLTSNITAAINFQYVGGQDLPRTVNSNLAPPLTLTTANRAVLGVEPVPQQLGRTVFDRTRRDPTRDAIFELQPTASSRCRAFTATLNRRLADEIEWTAAYTWSHAMDSASEFDEQPQNPYAVSDEWSDSRYDARHRLVASAVFDLPIGEDGENGPPDGWQRAFSHISVAPILTIASGHPINATTGADDNRTGAWPLAARPLGISRNSLRLPWSATLDLRVLKYFAIKPHGKLDLVVEAFNVLNRTNATRLNAVYGAALNPLASFGRAIDAASARQIQFSIDFEF